ncbi:SGNH/GDSL hydrolase family protein [Zavarzinella formosa]|uniref:SGNH/GDSL hydrolase family protein n=1 Tax=Zavarzinella formosa TaxID=360055 RepID=UPI000318741D|nr:SGNH/GDSL hydrolase family protein [Zavarzinella formosa]
MIRVLLFLLCVPFASFAQELIPVEKGKADPKDPIVWYDLRLSEIEGQAWKDTKSLYDRFPARAEGKVPASVWGLSQHSAGLAARFVTDANSVRVRWSLTSDRLAMPHMPATGVSGVDLYVRSNADGRWHWAGVGQPAKKEGNTTAISMFPGKKECLLYLPLYNGTASVEIGLPKTATLSKGPPRAPQADKPILFYGTSITQGGCASRPGMVHTAILGRRLERPVLNFGFSGSGRMDEGVVALLAELDPAVYVIDCLPNMQEKEIAERTAPLVNALRKARPTTPILLVEDRTYANATVNKSLLKRNLSSRAAFQAEYAKLVEAKIPGLVYLKGDTLLGADGEDTVDGSHPTDLGFVRHADAFEKVLRELLPAAPKNGKSE